MTAPIKTCDFCNATGVMPTFMDGTTVCYGCLPTLPKTLREAWREIVLLRAKIERMERQEPVKYEFQDRDGKWYPFIDQRHYENTVAVGAWPIRSLYALPGAKGEEK